MNATLSADGQRRIDMRITFRAGIGELVGALCSAYRNHSIEDDGPLPALSKAATTAAIRDEFYLRGGSGGLDGWSDYQSNEETREWLAWAEEQVRRAYPELDEAELRQAEAQPKPLRAACIHGYTPRSDVVGNPVAACAAMHGAETFGAFNPEGCFEARDCAVEIANIAAEEALEDDDITWGLVCPDHPEWPKDKCQDCHAEPSDDEDDDEV